MNTHSNTELDRTLSAVRSALAASHISGLHVELVDDCVALHGDAACYDAKRQAGEAAQLAAPGCCIANEIRVSHAGFIDDATIERDVAQAIARLGGDVLERIRIEVHEGVVHLYGTARDAEERQALSSAAWAATCVTRVENHLMLHDSLLADTEVARALNEYVHRAMNLPRGVIAVDYAAGVASLSGSVASETQGLAIEELVRWHDQVNDVVNRLRIAPAVTVRGARVRQVH